MAQSSRINIFKHENVGVTDTTCAYSDYMRLLSNEAWGDGIGCKIICKSNVHFHIMNIVSDMLWILLN